jgi:hypothetical protein
LKNLLLLLILYQFLDAPSDFSVLVRISRVMMEYSLFSVLVKYW